MKTRFKWLGIIVIAFVALAITISCSKNEFISEDELLEEAKYCLFMGDSLTEISKNKTKIGVLFKGPDLPNSWELDLSIYSSKIESLANGIIDYSNVPKRMKKIHKHHVNGMHEYLLGYEKFLLGIENMDDNLFEKSLKHLKKGDNYLDKGFKLLNKL